MTLNVMIFLVEVISCLVTFVHNRAAAMTESNVELDISIEDAPTT